jgi:hypothetical protein
MVLPWLASIVTASVTSYVRRLWTARDTDTQGLAAFEERTSANARNRKPRAAALFWCVLAVLTVDSDRMIRGDSRKR